MTRPPDVKILESRDEEIKARKERAIKDRILKEPRRCGTRKTGEGEDGGHPEAWRATARRSGSQWMKMIFCTWWPSGRHPLKRMEQGEAKSFWPWKEELGRVVVGQKEAVTALCKALRRSRADLKDPRRPDWHLCLLGPTEWKTPAGQNIGGADVWRLQVAHPAWT